MSKARTIENVTLVVLFLGTIVTIAIATWIFEPDDIAGQELRLPAPLPVLAMNKDSIAAFPAAFQAYFADRIAFRKELLTARNFIDYRALSVSRTPSVIAGKDGWLYYGGEQSMDYYRNITPLSRSELAMWERELNARKAWLNSRQIKFLVVMAPTKQSIYPEKFPAAFNRVHVESRLDQWLSYLRAHTDLDIIDLRPVLLARKSAGKLYYRLDSHWTTLGGFFGYEAIAQYLTRWFPQIQPFKLSDFQVRTVNNRALKMGDLAKALRLSDVLSERCPDLYSPARFRAKSGSVQPLVGSAPSLIPNTNPMVYRVPDARLPRAVVLRDSFAWTPMTYLAEHFQRSYYHWGWDFPQDVIESEKPNVVILEICEYKLLKKPPVDASEPKSMLAQSAKSKAL